ncbi:WD-40 repeat protein [Chloroherpeton thalassium ATCC 35110]|uniref:WD-40 repeat protein n=1 Tax=Chloroherpeton thalassium (strain ATCC 35110 / GB-78) TaxID=517418 RepID=B3QZ64_CHLT3|nr:WD40 repeat domain-containing protein [Chloroherpeton thalassium]ACF13757.1 WD-40 repeat protein [Chloroherpeton thalassium ATCC 35110]
MSTIYTGQSSSKVNAFAFSPDHSFLAVANWKIIITDILTGKEFRSLITPSMTEYIYTIAYSRDGKTLISAGSTKDIRLWNTGSGRESGLLTGHKLAVNKVVVSPNGKLLASASNDGTVRLWDTQTWRALHTLKGHEQEINAVAFSSDSRFVVSGSTDKMVLVWNALSGELIHSFVGHTRLVAAVAFSPDDRLVVSSGWDSQINIWSMETGNGIGSLTGHPNGIHKLCFLPRTGELLSVSYDRFRKSSNVKLWDISARKELNSLTGDFYNIEVSQNGNYLAIAKPNRQIMVSHINDLSAKTFGQLKAEIAQPEDQGKESAENGTENDDRKVAAPRRHDNRYELGDVFEPTQVLNEHSSSRINSLAFSSDGSLLASASWKLSLMDVESGDTKYNLIEFVKTGYIYALAFNPKGNLFAAAGTDKFIRIFETSSGNEKGQIEGHNQVINSLAFHPNGYLLASGGNDGWVKTWDTRKESEIDSFHEHEDAVTSVAFSSDGRFLASAGNDKIAVLWNAGTGKKKHTLVGHSRPVTCVAFSPNAKFLATGSWDRSIKLWNLETGLEEICLAGHPVGIDFIAFSPNGKMMIASGYNRVRKLSIMRLWDIEKKSTVAALSGNFYTLALSDEKIAFAYTNRTIQISKVPVFEPETFKHLEALLHAYVAEDQRPDPEKRVKA